MHIRNIYTFVGVQLFTYIHLHVHTSYTCTSINIYYINVIIYMHTFA